MRRGRIVLIILFFLVIIVLPINLFATMTTIINEEVQDKGSGKVIEGIVYDKETGKPIEGVRVNLYPFVKDFAVAYDVEISSIYTNSDGYFSFDKEKISEFEKNFNLRIKKVTLSYEKDGYLFFPPGYLLLYTKNEKIEEAYNIFKLNKKRKKFIKFGLIRERKLKGIFRIKDKKGIHPLKNYDCDFFTIINKDKELVSEKIYKETKTTDDKGIIEISRLTPDCSYFIRFRFNGFPDKIIKNINVKDNRVVVNIEKTFDLTDFTSIKGKVIVNNDKPIGFKVFLTKKSSDKNKNPIVCSYVKDKKKKGNDYFCKGIKPGYYKLYAVVKTKKSYYVKSSEIQIEENKIKAVNIILTESNSFHDFTASNNDFAFKLYKELISNDKYKDDNLFFSNIGIYNTLLMAYIGAKGDTKAEIGKIIGLTNISDDFLEKTSVLLDILNKENIKDKFKLVNLLIGKKGYGFLQDYINKNKKYFGSEFFSVDLEKNIDEAINIINNWVKKRTNNTIEQAINSSMIDDELRLLLMNTVFFDAKWKNPFNSANISYFYETKKKIHKVPLMEKVDYYSYCKWKGIQVIKMNYVSGEYSMVVFLPKSGKIDKINKYLNGENFGKLFKKLKRVRKKGVEVFFPKFELKREYNMEEILKQMGMVKSFTQDADFSSISKVEEDFFLSKIFHKTYVNVYEEGTRAAAATYLCWIGSPRIEKVFRADHPFLYFIVHEKTGIILFMGKFLRTENNSVKE